MPLNISNPAEIRWLTHFLTAAGTISCDLFKNDITLDEDTDEESFLTADYSGYFGVNLAFGAVATDGSGRAFALSDDVEFPLTSSSMQTVYGYYMLDSAGYYVGGRRFATPVVVDNVSGVDVFNIKLRLREDA